MGLLRSLPLAIIQEGNMKQSFYYESENFVVLIEKVLGIPNSNYNTNNAIFNSVNNILYKYNLENTLSVKNASYEGTNICFDIVSNNDITKDVFFDNLSKFVNILNKK